MTSAPSDATQARPAALRLRWSRRFPGTPEQVARTRHWLQELLPPCQARSDLLTIASELAANAVRHTRSQLPGGTFGMNVSWSPDIVRLVVGDQGAPTPPAVVPDSDGTGGLGLLVVSKMALQWGVAGGAGGRNVWADLPWHHDGDPVPAVLAVLAHQYPDSPAWHGQGTGKWRAALPS